MKIAYELPETILDNAELIRLYADWTEEKIVSKTGVASRRVAASDETAVDLAERAARRLFREQGVAPDSLDFVLLCTQSPAYRLPTSACILQDRLGLPTTVGALDFNLGCSGFIYGLSLAKGLVASGAAKSIMLLTAETYTKYIAKEDRSTRTIVGTTANCRRTGPYGPVRLQSQQF